MSPVAEQVLQAARSLPPDDQRDVIDALLADLDEPSLDPAWLAEIRRRSAEFEAGQVTPISWTEVKAKARQGETSRG